MSALEISTRDGAAGPVLKIVGDLAHATAGELREPAAALALRSGRRLVVDLGGMEYCDSSGITALIVVRNHAIDADAEVALAAVPDHTVRVLRVVGLDQIFALHPDSGTAGRVLTGNPAPPDRP
jgi:anti-sigma B factor antagonist